MTATNTAIPDLAQATLVEDDRAVAEKWLRRSAQFWYAIALAGQVAFTAYILGFYSHRTLVGDFAGWNDKPAVVGYLEGDALGNFMFITHVFGATIIALGGMLQLLPYIRKKWPLVHRWIGRSFMVMALLMATGGIMMTWLRGDVASVTGAIAMTVDGCLIVAFAVIAWRLAAARKFQAHARWALRTFMVANGVWFLRLMSMAWSLATGGWGMTGGLSAPAFVAMQFACYLVPLALLELYFFAQGSASGLTKRWVAGTVGFATLLMAVGVGGAQLFMWAPYYL